MWCRRRRSVEGLKRWCVSKKPGQGPGLSTVIDSVDIAWMDGESRCFLSTRRGAREGEYPRVDTVHHHQGGNNARDPTTDSHQRTHPTELPGIDAKWADTTPDEFAFEEMSADETIEIAKM